MCSSGENLRLVTLSAVKLSLAARVTAAFVPGCPAHVPGPGMNNIKVFFSDLKWRNEKHQMIYVVSVHETVIRHDVGDGAGDIVIL